LLKGLRFNNSPRGVQYGKPENWRATKTGKEEFVGQVEQLQVGSNGGGLLVEELDSKQKSEESR
jgi:hypothetical protein